MNSVKLLWGKSLSEVPLLAQNISKQCALTLSRTCLLRKKLLRILINNEKIHNILGIYGVLCKTFKGYMYMWGYLGPAETDKAV